MAITKLMNICEVKTKSGKSSPKMSGTHLKNSIEYVLNPEKTQGGLLCGSNISTDAQEAYQRMMDTKREWNEILDIPPSSKENKLFGRQGYHFVISWEPGACDSQTAYEVIKEFCKEYLGDKYEYVFSVHDDQDHMHGHIIFNSVSREDGYKYHYEKGDWKKYIQPITDRICEKKGLEKLTYKEKRVGKSYAEYSAQKKGKMTNAKIIQRDIDYAISHAQTFEDFLENMTAFGYTMRQGYAGKHGDYISWHLPGASRANRDYNLGKGYQIRDVKERIRKKDFKLFEHQTPRLKGAKLNGSLAKKTYMNRYQVRYVRRLHKAGAFYTLVNPFAVNQSQVRRDMRQINKLADECRYLLKSGIRSEKEAEKRLQDVTNMEKLLWKKAAAENEMEHMDSGLREEYQLLRKKLAGKEVFGNESEELEDRLNEIIEQVPESILEVDSRSTKQKLSDLRKEKRILSGLVHEKNVPNFGTEKKVVTHSIKKEEVNVRR